MNDYVKDILLRCEEAIDNMTYEELIEREKDLGINRDDYLPPKVNFSEYVSLNDSSFQDCINMTEKNTRYQYVKSDKLITFVMAA